MFKMRQDLTELKKLTKHVLKPREKPFNFDKLCALVELTHHAEGIPEFFIASNRHMQIICRYSAWKYCCVLHAVMRDGPQNVSSYASNCRRPLCDIRNYWATQSDEMGNFITAYCKVLLKKLDFHETFPWFGGNLYLFAETVQFDINLCFELTTDIYDFLELLLELQTIIFAGVSLQQVAAESAQSKVRLQPLGNIAAECCRLYEYTNQTLHILHMELPNNDVEGLYKRFCVLHIRLRDFYLKLQQVSALVNLQSVPQLPEAPPCFYTERAANVSSMQNGLYPPLQEVPPYSYTERAVNVRSMQNGLYPQLPAPSAPMEWEL